MRLQFYFRGVTIVSDHDDEFNIRYYINTSFRLKIFSPFKNRVYFLKVNIKKKITFENKPDVLENIF